MARSYLFKTSIITHPFQRTGEILLFIVDHLGASLIFFSKAIIRIFGRRQFNNIISQVLEIGTRSITIVVIVGLFTGMVLGLQLYYTLVKFGSQGVIGAAISLALIRELGPVLTAIMVTARSGSAMAAEIGVQRISEQIDALYTMGINPMGFLVSPRIAASILSFPLLTAFFDIVGIFGGWVTGVVLLGTNEGSYFYSMETSVDLTDLKGGFIKSAVFAVIVSTICCYQGFFTHTKKNDYGARSVGASTTSAVVISCVMILVSDYIVTSFLM